MFLIILGLICFVIGGFCLLRFSYVMMAEGLFGSVKQSPIPFYMMFVGLALYFLRNPVIWIAVIALVIMLFK